MSGDQQTVIDISGDRMDEQETLQSPSSGHRAHPPTPLQAGGSLPANPGGSPAHSTTSSTDSFSWLEEDEEQAVEQDDDWDGQRGGGSGSGGGLGGSRRDARPLGLRDLLPPGTIDWIALSAFLGLLLPSLLAMIRVPIPEFGYVAIDVWCLLLWMTMFLPFFLAKGIYALEQAMRQSPVLVQLEAPAHLEAIRRPLTFLLTSLLISFMWFTRAPITCPLPDGVPTEPPSTTAANAGASLGATPAEIIASSLGFDASSSTTQDPNPPENPLTVCWLQYAPNLSMLCLAGGIIFIVQGLVMRWFRASFLANTYRNRIIDTGFRVYVVGELKKRADILDAERRREHSIGGGGGEVTRDPTANMLSQTVPPIGVEGEEGGEIISNRSLPFELPPIVQRAVDALSVSARSVVHSLAPTISSHHALSVEAKEEEQETSVMLTARSQTPSSLLTKSGQPAAPQVTNAPASTHSRSQPSMVPVPERNVRRADYSLFKAGMLRTLLMRGYDSASNTGLLTDAESKYLARHIFHRLTGGRRSVLLEADDFLPVFGTKRACADAFAIFDRDRDGEVTKHEFRTTMISIFKEQRHVQQSIEDAGQAIAKLDGMIRAGLWLLILFLGLGAFNVQVQSLLTVGLSVILGLNFIIGDTARSVFVSLIFLFVNHPYDVGDRVTVGSVSNVEVLTVKRINLLDTVFKRWNGHEVYCANSQLAGTQIINISRCREQWERIDFEVCAGGGRDLVDVKLGHFRDNLEAWLRLNQTDYHTIFDLRAIVAADVGRNETSLDTLCFTLRVQCRPTVDPQKRWSRHARLIAFVRETVQQVGLRFASQPEAIPDN